MDGNLIEQDRAILLGTEDGLTYSYDHEFYEKMKEIAPLHVEDVDDGVRRAILRFILDGSGQASKPENGGLVMMGFLHGYQIGRKLKRDITKEPKIRYLP